MDQRRPDCGRKGGEAGNKDQEEAEQHVGVWVACHLADCHDDGHGRGPGVGREGHEAELCGDERDNSKGRRELGARTGEGVRHEYERRDKDDLARQRRVPEGWSGGHSCSPIRSPNAQQRQDRPLGVFLRIHQCEGSRCGDGSEGHHIEERGRLAGGEAQCQGEEPHEEEPDQQDQQYRGYEQDLVDVGFPEESSGYQLAPGVDFPVEEAAEHEQERVYVVLLEEQCRRRPHPAEPPGELSGTGPEERWQGKDAEAQGPDAGRAYKGPGDPFDRDRTAPAVRVEEGKHHGSDDGSEREKGRGDRRPQRDRKRLGPVELQDTQPRRAEGAQLPHVGPPAAHDVAHHQGDEEEEGERGRGSEGDQRQACRETLALDGLEERRQARNGGAARQCTGEVDLQVAKPGTGVIGRPCLQLIAVEGSVPGRAHQRIGVYAPDGVHQRLAADDEGERLVGDLRQVEQAGGAPLPVCFVGMGTLGDSHDLRPHPDRLIDEGGQGEDAPDLDSKWECAGHRQYCLHDWPAAIVVDYV